MLHRTVDKNAAGFCTSAQIPYQFTNVQSSLHATITEHLQYVVLRADPLGRSQTGNLACRFSSN
jgi:hypothetical protein